jgi:hypothetical protein
MELCGTPIVARCEICASRIYQHEVRALGNDSAHPTPGDEGPTAKDARDIVDFLSMLLTMVYNLPHEIAEYRARKPA